MSQRVKKPGRSADDSQGKRRRRRPSGSDADEDGTRSGSNSGGNGSLTGMWTPRHLNDLKVSSIYNRNSAEAPAELYRKDLISAMKLPDSEPLTPEEYWLITDSWKQEWEKGVQVPVNPESLPEPEVKLIQPVADRSHDFRLPKKKYVRVTHDDFFNPDYHQLVSTAARAEKVCSYDLDDVDAAWLGCSNADRAMQNMTVISEFLMEQVIEELELQCWEQVQTILKSQEGLGIEYDENVICDVCRSPESEEGNEMVFCDSCNICVHQACYGITTIPSGSWLCRTCTLGMKPTCVLCPNLGGAMKATRSGHTWAHVACAIWIPEVSIGSVEKMEPITKISAIPQSRWSLICVLCKEKTGACIQCSVKTCKTAYHVTCAFKNGLEMKPIIVDENAEDGIKLRSYCQKHSVNTKKDKSQSGSEDDAEKKKIKAMTAEERNQARAEKLQQIEAEFYKYVRLKDVSQNLAVDMDVVMLVYNYWKLKRKSLNNRPLVPPRPETTQLLTQQQEQDLEQMKMFVQLRQDLERVRNLCYMVSRREKLSRSFFRLREQTFQKQLAILSEKNDLTVEEKQAILTANQGPSIYDQFYSHHSTSTAPGTSTAGNHKSSIPDYDSLISLIAGVDAKKDLVNGVIKSSKRQKQAGGVSTAAPTSDTVSSAASNSNASNNTSSGNSGGNASGTVTTVVNSNSDRAGANPYKKQFVNGARRRNLLGERGSGSSHSESESEVTTAKAGESAAATTVNNTTSKGTKKGAANNTTTGKGATGAAKNNKGNRKPLSYLFDSDSSLDNLTSGGAATAAGGKKAAAGKVAKGKAKGKAAAPNADGKSNKPVKSTSYLSDSDELELPVGRRSKPNTAGNVKDNVPIYSDSEESDAKGAPAAAGPKKDTKTGKAAAAAAAAAAKKKVTKKTKAATPSAQQDNHKKIEEPSNAVAESKGKKSKAKATAATPKGKGKAATGKKGKNKDGFDPTELIVPQREAAKKATESIRSVKQKTKDSQQSSTDVIEAVATGAGVVAAPASTVSIKEEAPKEPVKGTKSTSKLVVSSLSESEGEEKPVVKGTSKDARKPKTPEKKSTKTRAKASETEVAAEAQAVLSDEDTGDVSKDEFEFDMVKDGSSKNVSYVPQRQAAKKAAEHIRSGLSNIVAARLIIEDEMEAARKKTKNDKGQVVGKLGVPDQEEKEEDRVSVTDSSRIESAVVEAAKKVTNKERTVAKGSKAAKGSKKETATTLPSEPATSGKVAAAASNKEARGIRDPSDWPFLDKGSQSACRRSRERSSSSTSSSGSSDSSSSGSSCSSRSSSASTSRSSSAESASPEPRSPVVTKKASSVQPAQHQQIISSVVNKLSASSQDSGPGRKLKTSERCPSSRAKLRAETPSREKPAAAAKSGRPTKSGSGRGDPFRSAFSPSPEPEPKPPATAQRQQSDKRNSSPAAANHNKVSPVAKTNEQQQRGGKSKNKSPVSASVTKALATESPEKKSGRRKGEPSSKVTTEIEKGSDSEAAVPPTQQASVGTKRSPSKASIEASKRKLSPVKHTGLHLSSDSETETQLDTHAASGKSEPVSRSRNSSSRSQPKPAAELPSTSSPSSRKRKSMATEGANLALSDSEESGTEEKENTDQSQDHHPSTPAAQTKSGSQRGSTPSAGGIPATSILSPLTPTENKEKETSGAVARLSDTEQPEAKRSRLDSGAPSSSSAQIKSIFSPQGSTGGGREGEILDFDSELYDLARSVVTDEYAPGEEGHSSGSLSFSLSQALFNREDNKEDSARATLNLVEKLRLQHARKSGIHRPSTESSSDTPCDILEDGKSPSRPDSSLQDDSKLDDTNAEDFSSAIQEVSPDGKPAPNHSTSSSIEPPNLNDKSPTNLLQTVASPDRTKQSIQGDERWVPPSSQHVRQPSSSPAASQGSAASAPPTVSIPTTSPAVSSPRSVYHSQQSPPISRQAQMAPQSHPDGEVDKHRNHPSPFHHSRPHGSRSSASGDSDKGSVVLSVDTLPSPAAASPLVSPILSGLHQGRNTPSQVLPPPPYSAAAAAAAVAATMAAAEASPNLAAAGLPFGGNPFMYNPALASVLAAAAASPNNPLAPFLQVPMPKTSPAGLGPCSPPLNFPSQNVAGFTPFLPSAAAAAIQQAQQQHQASTGQGQLSQSKVRTPAPSPSGHSKQQQQQRRPSDVGSLGEGKMGLNSPLVSVAASMPLLAKPPLTSPSVLLAANNMKTVTPPAPTSAVAHIIESVVNNHASGGKAAASSSGLPKMTLSLDLHLPPTSLAPVLAVVAPTSTNTSVKTPLTSPVVPSAVVKQAPGHGAVNDTDISSVLANKTTENIITPAVSKASRDGSSGGAGPGAGVPPTSITNAAVSPKQAAPSAGGRGRRASTPRATAAAIKAAEKLSGVNAVIEDMMMSPQPKAKGRKGAAQSPARGKAPATPRRGASGGRGKGKGKNLVGVRKDLAGTVYDIDFDEFEENSEEKIDLRALRERRKSSEVHSSSAGEKHSKNSSVSSEREHAPHTSPIILTLPVPHPEKHSRHHKSSSKEEGREHHHKRADRAEREREREEAQLTKQQQKQALSQQQLQQQLAAAASAVVAAKQQEAKQVAASPVAPATPAIAVPDKTIHPILQAPLPGPVDMRTYSGSMGADESVMGKMGFPAPKDPSSEIASLFMSSSEVSGGTGSSTTVNDLEELDKALEVLVATPKPAAATTPATSSAGLVATASSGAVSHTQQPSTSLEAVNDVISSNVSSISSQNNTQQPSATTMNSVLPPGAGGKPPFCNQQVGGPKEFEVSGAGVSTAGSSVPPGLRTTTVPESSSDDMSRNQLKVKIKGPFLDANYSSTNSMHPSVVGTGVHPHHHPYSFQQSMAGGGVPPHLATAAGYPPQSHSSYGGPDGGSYPPHHQHHHQWMMSAGAGGSSNLRRMRKKELLRQYWTQDMNMDGGSNSGFPPGPGGSAAAMGDMSGLPSYQGVHPHHPISRSVITIPKAVASMSILPTKEDYRLDNPEGNESNDSNEIGLGFEELWPGRVSPISSKTEKEKTEGTQKKRRSRGIYREMAALGLPTPDAPRERRRERNASATGSGNTPSDSNSRKRIRGSNKPSRSTFIPPTLAESADAPVGIKSSIGMSSGGPAILATLAMRNANKESNSNNNPSASAVSTVVNVVNHPTPKLKIKFGDLSNSVGGGSSSSSSLPSGISLGSSSLANNSSNHLSDSDRDTPNKKAKGRPPKKRGLLTTNPISSLPTPTDAAKTSSLMEKLKRENLNFREEIMKEYAMAEQQEILKLSGTRRNKKKKRKAGASTAGSETDDTASVRSKSPEVKVIDGPKPKLILRFGKARSSSTVKTGGSDNGSNSSNSGAGEGVNNIGKVNENGLPPNVPTSNIDGILENDSGFTGSSEGSSGSCSVNEPSFRNTKTAQNGGKEKTTANNNNTSNTVNNNSNGNGGGSGAPNNTSSSSDSAGIRNGGDVAQQGRLLELDSSEPEKLASFNSSSTTTPNANTPNKVNSKKSTSTTCESSSSSAAGGNGGGEKYVPIRLKLSRCYEGYSLKNKDGFPAMDVAGVVDRENGGASNTPKQSDSCQVR